MISSLFIRRNFTGVGVGSGTSPLSRLLSSSKILTLNNIANIDGATKKRKRIGRGVGSGLGKLGGYGHQFSRSTPRGFEGGQTPMFKRFPKIGFTNHGQREFQVINLQTIQRFIDMGRLLPKPNTFLTMRDLVASGVIGHVKDGVKILATGKDEVKTPIHLEVSAASTEAIKAIEAVGGTVTCVHFNQLALRAVVKPYKFDILPRRARPPPGIVEYYLDYTKSGYLSPEIQARNLKLFGTITSEDAFKAEHDKYMSVKRKAWREEMSQLYGVAPPVVPQSAIQQ